MPIAMGECIHTQQAAYTCTSTCIVVTHPTNVLQS